MSSIKLFSPATVANVACGFDVLGFALENPGDEMIFRLSKKPGVHITKIESPVELPMKAEDNVAGVAALALLNHLDSQVGVEIEIYKKIKPGSGIGSSSASGAGAAFGVNALLGFPFETKDLVQFAMQGEVAATGSAHADNVAPALLGGFTLVRSYSPLDVISIDSPDNLYATVIHPQIEVKTADARKILKEYVPLKKAITQWGNVAGLVVGLMRSDYDLIGRSLEDVIIEPIRSILIPGYQELKAAAMDAGALGGSISGSGPSVFALSESHETALKVREAMKNVYGQFGVDFDIHVSPVAQQGVRILD